MTATSRRIDLQTVAPALLLISGVASAVVFWWNRDSLWEDEIIAITHGLQPFPGFFVEILRNDIHPFFYFLLLKLWASPNIASDAWALASSLASATLSVVVIAGVTYRIHGRRAALWAAAIFCVLPTFAWAAGNLRMYGLMPGMAVASWYANREFLRTGRRAWAGGLVLMQLMLTYTHAIGCFFAAFFALAALIEQWRPASWYRLRLWAVVQAVSVIFMLPVVASALVRGTEPLETPSLLSFVSYPAQLLSVWGSPSYSLALGGGAFVLLLVAGMSDKRSQVPILVIPCGALIACIVVSSMGKPMFKSPVFTANLVPFLVMGAAAAIAKSRLPSIPIVATACAVFVSVGTWIWVKDARIAGNYQSAAEYLIARARPGDVVVVPHVSVYWGIMRYATGPTWGYPLAVMPLQSNDAWARLKDRLGPAWVERLGLNPLTDHVDTKQVRYVIGTAAQVHGSRATRVWVVHRHNYKETVQLGIPVRVAEVSWFGGELSVSLAVWDSAGSTSIMNPEK